MMYEVQKVEVSDDKGKASVSNVSSLGAVAWLDAPEDNGPILLDGVAHRGKGGEQEPQQGQQQPEQEREGHG